MLPSNLSRSAGYDNGDHAPDKFADANFASLFATVEAFSNLPKELITIEQPTNEVIAPHATTSHTLHCGDARDLPWIPDGIWNSES